MTIPHSIISHIRQFYFLSHLLAKIKHISGRISIYTCWRKRLTFPLPFTNFAHQYFATHQFCWLFYA